MCFRPLAGLSCINLCCCALDIESRLASFRPLAGLSCINPYSHLAQRLSKMICFRPLAGLSCINLINAVWYKTDLLEFPSPRGVELHKPR